MTAAVKFLEARPLPLHHLGDTAQRDLSIAELDMVTAMTTYEKAKVELDRATGSTLEHNGIQVQDAVNGTIASQSP